MTEKGVSFKMEDPVKEKQDPTTRFENKIVGWMALSKLSNETLEYTALFVDRKHLQA